MTDDGMMPPAFYAAPSSAARRPWLDWWVLLHPPYTLWHLSYVAIGASIGKDFDGVRLIVTLVAFFLAVGIGAHALDELHDRPLRTNIRSEILVAAATTSILAAAALGVIGITRVGPWLGVFIIVGVALTCVYNLELFGGRLHNDVTFAAAWGAFPVLTGYYAQAETLRLPAFAAAAAAYWLSAAQRSLSTPARTLRRHVSSVEGAVTHQDGTITALSRHTLLAPLEAALEATAYGVVALAVSLVLHRSIGF